MEPKTSAGVTALSADPTIACCHYDGKFYRVSPDGTEFIVTFEHEFGFGGATEIGRFSKEGLAILFFTTVLSQSIKIDD